MISSFAFLTLMVASSASSLPHSSAAEIPPVLSPVIRSETYLRSLPPLYTSNITAAMFSEENPVHHSLFGPLRDLVASDDELIPYYHPRIITNKQQWDDILEMYADPVNFNKKGTWSYFFRSISTNGGPKSSFINTLADLERTGQTSLYTGRPYDVTSDYQDYRHTLEPLAKRISMSNSFNSDSFVLCSLWASVARKQAAKGQTPFIPEHTVDVCIDAAVAWAKIVLSHRAVFCNPDCPTTAPPSDVSFTTWWYLWDTNRMFSLAHNWFAGGTGIAFTYDLLYNHIPEEKRTVMRSAIAMFVLNRYAWGASETCTRKSPNTITHPHRAFSNWAAYNSNLYLANLAIEGETGFDAYTTAVLQENKGKPEGFNEGLHARYSALLEQYLKHSFYPDGATFEDGYSYFIAFREGSLGLLASHRRGSNVFGSARFRNLIHNAAQMSEPWRCGNLIGHASGGGNLYNAYPALFRYAYPQGALPAMIWRQRYGNFKNNDPCRIVWGQSYMQLAFLGGEHTTTADSPATLDTALQQHFKLSFYSPRRGLLIARSSISENAAYMHFDARPDAFIVGHDNADRGVFTFTALRQTWLDDLPWKDNFDSRKHSLMHVDGLAQDWKAPPAKMLKVQDDGSVVIAAADLTYVYNVHWSRYQSTGSSPPNHKTTVYNANGEETQQTVSFEAKEELDPWTLGWAADDSAEDIGFTSDMKMHGVEDFGFSGLWNWKRSYRTQELDYMVRSSVLVRSRHSEVGYGMIVDSVRAGTGSHVFESYLILSVAVVVDGQASSCTQNRCKIVLRATSGNLNRRMDIHVIAKGDSLMYRTETFGGKYQRVIVKSTRSVEEEFWMVLHPHEGSTEGFSVVQNGDGSVTVSKDGDAKSFELSSADHTVSEIKAPLTPPSPQTTVPITPVSLRTTIQLNATQLVSNTAQFYHQTEAPYQVVFSVHSKTNVWKKLQDRFSTCMWATTVRAEIIVYDCGADDEAEHNYFNRACELQTTHAVEGHSNSGDTCKDFRTQLRVELTRWKRYFVVVSVFPMAETPLLAISHGTTQLV